MKDDGRKILIVDDEPQVAEVLRVWLTDEGFEVSICNNGREALQTLEDQKYDLIISDISMPHMGGMELMQRVLKRWKRQAIIMVTGVDDRNTASQALMNGAYGYVIKPFDFNEILINVDNALRRNKLELMRDRYEKELEEEVKKRTTEIKQREVEVTSRLLIAAEFRDNDTGHHIFRIGEYSALLAEKLGWGIDDVKIIRQAAPMHDVGKIGIPDNILLKPGKLTAEEFDVMKTHSEIGAKILSNSNVPMLIKAHEIALYHHEKWNGSGYPRGLKKQEIPQSARIVAIADVYDALRSKRVYCDAVSEQGTIDIMMNEVGTHFDPDLFEIFITLRKEFAEIFEKFQNSEILDFQLW